MRKMIRPLPFHYRRQTSRKRAAMALLRTLGAYGTVQAGSRGADHAVNTFSGKSAAKPAKPARLQAAARSSTVYGNSLQRHDSAVPDMEIHR